MQNNQTMHRKTESLDNLRLFRTSSTFLLRGKLKLNRFLGLKGRSTLIGFDL